VEKANDGAESMAVSELVQYVLLEGQQDEVVHDFVLVCDD
jgi:hypothetical protein